MKRGRFKTRTLVLANFPECRPFPRKRSSNNPSFREPSEARTKRRTFLREWVCPLHHFLKEGCVIKGYTITESVDYFRVPRPLWRKIKKDLPKRTKKETKRGGRPRVSERAVINGIWYVLWTGCQWKDGDDGGRIGHGDARA